MAILGALSIARSGLVATGEALSVTGNNIANVNTTAFKGSRPEFAELLTTQTGGGSGLGVRLAEPTTSFVQGSIESTSRPLDLAIEGRGFFVAKDGEAQVYTRAGNFSLDSSGKLVTSQGLLVQGKVLDPTTNLPTGALTDIDFGIINGEVSPTSAVGLQNNLSADALDTVGPFDGTDYTTAYATSNFTRTVQVHDSLGKSHDLILFFTKTAANAWTVNVGVDGADVAGGTAGELQPTLHTANLTFGTDGSLESVDSTDFTVDFDGATAGQSISLDLGTATADGGTGLDGVVQRGGPTSLVASPDGFGAGQLRTVSVEENGIVVGHFDNGESRPLYQVGVADFASPDKLASLGNGLYRESVGSGAATEVTPGADGLGRVIEQAIERSNVDLATEFVNLISLQRAFQANARVITTSDGLLSELINIVR